MTRESELTRLLLPVTGQDHIQGLATAPVTLVEYGDYECLYCGKAYFIVRDIKRILGERLRFVFRNFPLKESHRYAERAAEAAEAAGGQGKFWEMHEQLFEHQRSLKEPHLVQYAETLNLNMDKFKHDMAGHSYAHRVHDDFTGGVRSGVNGTPTFFINGVRHIASFDLLTLLTAIEVALPPG